MSGGDDGDNTYDVGKGKPPKEHQFAPGKSGNPRGRPPKRKSILAPRETDRIILRLLDEKVEIRTPAGKKNVSKFELLMMQKVNQAVQGSRTQQNDTLKLAFKAMEARVKLYPEVGIADLLQDMAIDTPGSMNWEILNKRIRNIKGRY